MLSKTTLLAILAATGAQAKDGRTHGVAYFWSKPLVEARMDPIVAPGAPQSQHVHTVMGGNGFSVRMNENDAVNSKCTGSNVVGDKSNYWFPKLFFQDPKTKKFEGVDLVQLKAYYFFEGTDDEIKPFPPGFQMVSGDPFQRSNPYKTPWADHTAYDRNVEIQPISWSCGRKDGKQAYPEGVVARAGGSTQGPGFPNIKCDGNGSPLASYIHFPSCADLSQPFSNYGNNTAWPTIKYGANGSQKQNCPPGYTHLPHLFMEIHWDAMKFADRWQEGVDKQPFVLANGDTTGFGGHADFIAGWDENVLEHLIGTCDSGGHGDGLDSCPGVQNYNTGASANNPPNIHPQTCSVQPAVPEVITGALDKLPGCNPLQSGPNRASMCDCSGATPVCNGQVVAPVNPKPNPPNPSPTKGQAQPTTTKGPNPAPTGGPAGPEGPGGKPNTPPVGVPSPVPTSVTNPTKGDPDSGKNQIPGNGAGSGNEDNGEDGDDEDDDDEDDDPNACYVPEPVQSQPEQGTKPKASPVPYVRRAPVGSLAHQVFHKN